MSRYLQIGDAEKNEPLDLSSNSGWSQFLAWTASIDREKFPELHAFADNGVSSDPAKVLIDIEQARVDHPPISDVKGIVDTLVDYLAGETEDIAVV